MVEGLNLIGQWEPGNVSFVFTSQRPVLELFARIFDLNAVDSHDDARILRRLGHGGLRGGTPRIKGQFLF